MNKWGPWWAAAGLVFLLAGPIGADNLPDLYDSVPNVPGCDEGILKTSEKDQALDEVNRIRQLANLPPVTYHGASDQETAQAALIISANQTLDHNPSPSASCYSDEGFAGSSTSNLYMVSSSSPSWVTASKDHVRTFLVDESVSSLGHRRWILDPFLKFISYGRVDGVPSGGSWVVTGSALKVIFSQKQDLTGTDLAFVAYPCGNYPPELVNLAWYWSFSVLADPAAPSNNTQVDFSQASITVTGDAGPMTVTGKAYDTSGFGLPNVLKWFVSNALEGTTYQVRIDNVLVGGTAQSYEYDVTVTSNNLGGCPNTAGGGGGGGGGGDDDGGGSGGGGGGCFLTGLMTPVP